MISGCNGMPVAHHRARNAVTSCWTRRGRSSSLSPEPRFPERAALSVSAGLASANKMRSCLCVSRLERVSRACFSLSFVILLSSRCVTAYLRAVVGGARKIRGKWVDCLLQPRPKKGEFPLFPRGMSKIDRFILDFCAIQVKPRGGQ